MAEKSYEELRKDFLSRFELLAPYKHRYDVFRDFITMSAITLRNAVVMNDELEQEYLKIIGSYQKADQQVFPQLLALVVEMLQFEPRDVLGNLYEGLELTSKNVGQFFTPKPVSELMAEILHGEELRQLDKPFITLSEPACGAGGMVLGFVKAMIRAGHNPADRLWVQAIDVDRLAALMCYVQLSLWNVPAEILVGNCLSLEMRERWLTPAHILGNWNYKLQRRSQEEAMKRESEPSTPDELQKYEPELNPVSELASKKPVQFDFGF